jgi:hypothetical protein
MSVTRAQNSHTTSIPFLQIAAIQEFCSNDDNVPIGNAHNTPTGGNFQPAADAQNVGYVLKNYPEEVLLKNIYTGVSFP